MLLLYCPTNTWYTLGHLGTPWDTLGHPGTPWDTLGHYKFQSIENQLYKITSNKLTK